MAQITSFPKDLSILNQALRDISTLKQNVTDLQEQVAGVSKSYIDSRKPQVYQKTAGATTLNAATYTTIASTTFTLPDMGGPWRLLLFGAYYLGEAVGGNAVNVISRVTDGTFTTNSPTDGEATTVSGNVIGVTFFDYWGILLKDSANKTFSLQSIVSNAGDTYSANGVLFTIVALPS